VLIVVFTFFFKIFWVSRLDYVKPDPDAHGYIELAQKMTNFYGASVREPLFVLWNKIWFGISKDNLYAVRIASVFAYSISAIFLFLILRRIFSENYALIGGIFYLYIPYSFVSHLRGLRLEFFLMLLLLSVYLTFFFLEKKWRSVLAGIVYGFLLLTRLESFIFIFFSIFYIFAFVKGDVKEKLISIAVALGVAFVLSFPFYFSCFKEKGSFFYVLNYHSKFWFSHEFAGTSKGRPPEISLKNPYNVDMNFFRYVFEERSFMDIPRKVVNGYVELFKNAIPHILRVPVDFRFLRFFIWAGILFSLFFTPTRVIFFWGMVFVFPYSFILSLKLVGYPSIDIRFAATSLPLICFGFIAFLYTIEKIFRKLKIKNDK